MTRATKRRLSALKWDDLRIFLALVEGGTTREASRLLGVSHPTISRRVKALEAALRAALVRRASGALDATWEGRDTIETARQIRELIEGLERRVIGGADRLSGPVRVSIPTAGQEVFLPILLEFQTVHRGCQLTLVASDLPTDVGKGEADVAIRYRVGPLPETLVGRRIGRAKLACYASHRYLRRHGRTPLAEHDWVAYEDQYGSGGAPGSWFRKHIPPEQVILYSGSPAVSLAAIEAGLGIGFLTRLAGDASAELVCLDEVEVDFGFDLWLLTHPDLRNTARVRKLMDHTYSRLVDMRSAFEGPALPGDGD